MNIGLYIGWLSPDLKIRFLQQMKNPPTTEVGGSLCQNVKLRQLGAVDFAVILQGKGLPQSIQPYPQRDTPWSRAGNSRAIPGPHSEKRNRWYRD